MSNFTIGLIVLAAMLQAYLLGSLDMGIIVSRLAYKEDVRTHGSGNAGMTNMLRTFGKKAAVITALGDVAKGALAAVFGRMLFALLPGELFSPVAGAYLAAILALFGHLKPVYFGFKGGKGVLVCAGVILATQPVLLPVLIVVFLAAFLPSKMVSLGSVLIAAVYPVANIALNVYLDTPTLDFVFAMCVSATMGVIVIYKHRSNLQRIANGTEYRFVKKESGQ